MEEETKPIESFDDFAKDLEIKKPVEEKDQKKFDVDSLEEEEGKPLYGPHGGCGWKTHPNAKNKKRGLKNHMKKCIFAPDYNKEELTLEEVPQQPPKKHKRNFKVNIEKNEKEKEVVEEIVEDKEEERMKLVNDLDILKVKFESIPFNWNYTSNSSLKHLKRQKSLFLRMLNDEAGTQAMFKLLVISSKAVEKVADVSNMIDLDGYATDVNDAHEEIYPILKNLVDTGVISVGHLTPELRLGMIMASLAINRIEKNKIKKNNFLPDASDPEQDFL